MSGRQRLGRRQRGVHRGEAGNAMLGRRTPDQEAVPHRTAPAFRRIDHRVDHAVVDHVHDVRMALGEPFCHLLDGDIERPEQTRGSRRCVEAVPRPMQETGDLDGVGLLSVGNGNQHGSVGR